MVSFFTDKDKKEVLERFIRYCKIDTQSEEDVEGNPCPSTQKQFDLAKVLVEELKALGIDVELSEHCYVYATVLENRPTKNVIGLMSHMDVSSESPSANVQPTIYPNISGEALTLTNGKTVIAKEDLEFYKGQDIIATDGNTLLGADDKSGIAAIMQFLTILVREGDKYPHGTIKICFNPDEEISGGVAAIDIKTKFNPEFAFTVDGGKVGEVENESFFAKKAVINIEGHEVHPGYGYNILVNAQRVMGEILNALPRDIAPETTRNREGYIHPTNSGGDTAHAKIDLILRDFDLEGMAKHVQMLEEIVDKAREHTPKAKIDLKITEQYGNMRTVLDKVPFLMETLIKSVKEIGVEPIEKPIRGGTDGSHLSFMGIPTPNIFAGGANFHSRREFIPIPSLYKVVELILTLVPKFIK